MKKVFSCADQFQLAPYKNALTQADIRYLIKNEFTSGAIGEIPINESWPQIWVLNDDDEQQALSICRDLEQSQLNDNKASWVCQFCGEHNDDSFEFCWQCQALPAQ